MSDYDFSSLNDKEFEVFVSDLLGDFHGVRYERFKPGRDSGVDGRYFSSPGNETVLQCKHWAGTPTAQLIRAVTTTERLKLEHLRPGGYVLAVSNALSRADKHTIYEALQPYIKTPSDIFGKEDLNDLVKKRPEIERRHYKLWLYSASVLAHILNKPIFDRSSFSTNEALLFAKKYVRTASHDTALEKLKSLGVVIITGEPGVGKTTLAEHICLSYVADGYQLIQISEEIEEAEAVFDFDQPQIFYFDDFLGRNYLEALSGHEGSKIVHFIRRVNKTAGKCFILTSRSTILNQGKMLIDQFQNENLNRNEFELTVSSLSTMDKAHILYNHLWYSSLPRAFVDELYVNKRYKKIVSHRNFNPRLISFITDATRFDDRSPQEYWPYVEEALENPTDVWQNPFEAQQDDYGRALVLLTTLHGKTIDEGVLSESFARFVARPENAGLKGHRDFLVNLRHLSGSLLSRRLPKLKTKTSGVQVDLFNPSIGDYVLRRYVNDVPTLRSAFLSQRSIASLETLNSLEERNLINNAMRLGILRQLLDEAAKEDYAGCSSEFIATASNALALSENHEADAGRLKSAAQFVISAALPANFSEILRLMRWAMAESHLDDVRAASIVLDACDKNPNEEELLLLAEIAKILEPPDIASALKIVDKVRGLVIEHLSDSLASDIYDFDTFYSVEYGDYDAAHSAVEQMIEDRLGAFALGIPASGISEILRFCDVEYELDRYHESMADRYDSHREATILSLPDEIDDLFERS